MSYPGKAVFGKNFTSNNAKLIESSSQPFGDASWQRMADLALSFNRDAAVTTHIPAGSNGASRARETQLGGLQQIVGFSISQPFLEPAFGNGTRAVEKHNDLPSAATPKKVLDEFDPLQQLGACSLAESNALVPEWKLSSWKHRTESGLSRREPNAPPGKYADEVYCVCCGPLGDHIASTCKAKLSERKRYKKSVDKDTGFAHNGKRRWYYAGQNQNFPQGRSSSKTGKGGFQNQPAFPGPSSRGLQIGSKVDNQAWYEVAEVIQASRIDKICQKMKMICSVLLNMNNYQAVDGLSSIMSRRISRLKRYVYDESENVFNSIVAYLNDYQKRL